MESSSSLLGSIRPKKKSILQAALNDAADVKYSDTDSDDSDSSSSEGLIGAYINGAIFN